MAMLTPIPLLFGDYFNVNLPPIIPPGPQMPIHSMDYERCAQLHNQIVEIGWQGSGRTLDDLPRKNWFEYYGESANATRPLFSSNIVAFLERVWVTEPPHSFFYYMNDLEYPEQMFRNHEIENSNAGYHRFLTLYSANNLASHPDGLVFDQETNTAIIQMSIFDSEIIHNGRQRWYPLETVLKKWLEMIEIGKIKAVPQDTPSVNEVYHPWMHLSYSEAMLSETVTTFNALVDAIESRMPGSSDKTKPIGILDDDIMEASKLPKGFAYEFLTKARRPSFRYIAPGLAVPKKDFGNQPFFPLKAPDPPRENEDAILAIPPILLFRSNKKFHSPSHPLPDNEHNLPSMYPYHEISKYPAGLYFASVVRESSNEFEDECIFVLPHGIGVNGYARKSDGSLFGENTADIGEPIESFNTHADLYQPGYTPFTEQHGVRIVHVFKNWLQMVENGDWKVGADGVVGGIKKWKDADELKTWEKYVIPVTW